VIVVANAVEIASSTASQIVDTDNLVSVREEISA
jgi:hypothetical protein